MVIELPGSNAQEALAGKVFNETNVTLKSEDTNAMVLELEALMTPLREQGLSTLRYEDAVDDLVSVASRLQYRQAIDLYYQTIDDIETAVYLHNLQQENEVLLDYAREQNINASEALVEQDRGSNALEQGNLEKSARGLESANALLLLWLEPLVEQAIAQSASITPYLNRTTIFYQRAKDQLQTLEQARRTRDFGTVFVSANELLKLNTSNARFRSVESQTQQLRAKGYAVEQLEDSLLALQDLFTEGQQTEFEILINESKKLASSIIPLDKRISSTAASLSDPAYADLELSEPHYYLNLSKHEFALGNYEVAEKHRAAAEKSVQELEQEFLLSVVVSKSRQRFDYVAFVMNNWLTIIILSILSYYAAKAGMVVYSRKKLSMHIESLKKEQAAIQQLMADLQHDYFRTQSIDKETYSGQSTDYEKRLTAIREEIPLTEEKKTEIDQRITSYQQRLQPILSRFGIRAFSSPPVQEKTN